MAQATVRLVDNVTLTTTTTFPDPSSAHYSGTEAYTAELNISGPVTGTSPTINVIIEGSMDEGLSWFQVVAFAQQTAVTATPVTATVAAGVYGHKLRTRAVVGGTTPSFGGVEVLMG